MKKNEFVCFIVIALMALVVLIGGCRNVGAKIGGSITIDLPAGERLIEITWKDHDSLWYLTRPREPNERPTTYKFQERSNGGVLEGVVRIVEH